MSDHHYENLKIFAFIGDRAADLIEHLTTSGYPKVSHDDMVSQIQHLAEAGQHYIVTDQLTDFELYKAMRHAFPGELTLVAITDKEKITQYLEQKPEGPQSWNNLENHQDTDLFKQADEYLETREQFDELHIQLNKLLAKHDASL